MTSTLASEKNFSGFGDFETLVNWFSGFLFVFFHDFGLLLGLRIMCSIRPAILAGWSTDETSDNLSTTCSASLKPNSFRVICRPKNLILILTLLPSSRNSVAFLSLVSRSLLAIKGVSLISLISDDLDFFLLTWFFFFCWYLKLEKLTSLATGGLAAGETRTRSKPWSRAACSASVFERTPICAALLSITRSVSALMNWLIW